MNARIKAGVTGGIFGGLFALITGGLSAYLAGIVAGTIAGLLASQNEPQGSPAGGLRQGLTAGVVAGGLTLLGALLRVMLIDPIIAPGTPAGGQLAAGAVALVLAVAVAALFGTVRGLAHPNDRLGTFIFLGALIALYPFLDRWTGLNFKNEVIPVLVFILMALGLNIVVGYAGLLDLGYAAFFAIGAYTTGMIASPFHGVEMPFWLAIWVAAGVAAIFGVILGAPTLPLRGDYLAIVTLGFGEIVPIAVNNLDRVTISILGYTIVQDFDLTGGPRGINPINRPWLPGIGEFRPDDQIPWYFLIVAIMIFSIFFINRLRGSRIGRAWMAMREDELAASAMGIDLVRTKLLAFSMGATFSGFAGAFYGAYISAIFPTSFDFSVSVMLLCMVILGGMGNITGVILGGLIIQFADRLFLPQLSGVAQKLFQATGNPALQEVNIASDFRLLLFGLTLVIVMLVRPEGLVPNERRRAELHAEEEPNESAGREGLATGS